MTFTFTLQTGTKRERALIRVNLTRIQQSSVCPERPKGYSKSHLSRVFAGKTKPSIPCLVAISEALGISLDELVDRLKGKRKKFYVERR
jgi:hypothetical protein